MIAVRINHVQLAKPGDKTTGASSAYQIVDAETNHSMGAGLWATRDLAESCAKRKRWRVVKPEEAAA